jgi:hypothetical protein
MYNNNNLERKRITVATLRNSTMQKACVIIAITSMEGIKNLGIARTISFMQMGCVKIAILIAIIVREGKKRLTIKMRMFHIQVTSRRKRSFDF